MRIYFLSIFLLGTGTQAFTTTKSRLNPALVAPTSIISALHPGTHESVSKLDACHLFSRQNYVQEEHIQEKKNMSLVRKRVRRLFLLALTAFTIFASGWSTSTPPARASSMAASVPMERVAASPSYPKKPLSRNQQARLKKLRQQKLQQLTPAQRQKILQKRREYLMKQQHQHQQGYHHESIYSTPAPVKRGLLSSSSIFKVAILAVAVSAATMVGSGSLAGNSREKLQRFMNNESDNRQGQGRGFRAPRAPNGFTSKNSYRNDEMNEVVTGLAEPFVSPSNSNNIQATENPTSKRTVGPPLPDMPTKLQTPRSFSHNSMPGDFHIQQGADASTRTSMSFKDEYQRTAPKNHNAEDVMLHKSEYEQDFKNVESMGVRPKGNPLSFLGLRRRDKQSDLARVPSKDTTETSLFDDAFTPPTGMLSRKKQAGNNGFTMIFQGENPMDKLPGGKYFKRTAPPTIHTAADESSQTRAARYMMWKGIARQTRKIDKRAITYVSAVNGSHDVDDLIIDGKYAYMKDGVTPVYATKEQLGNKSIINTGSDESSKHFALSYMFNKWLAKKMRRPMDRDSDVTYISANSDYNRNEQAIGAASDDRQYVPKLSASDSIPFPNEAISSFSKKKHHVTMRQNRVGLERQ